MRVILATTFLVISACAAAKCPPNGEKFLKNLISALQVSTKFLSFDEARKILQQLFDPIYDLKSMQSIGDDMKKDIYKYCPYAKLAVLNALKSAADKCLKIIAKIKTCKNKKMSKAATQEEGYAIANQWCNKGNITHVVKAARAQLTCKEWGCAQEFLPQVINIKTYDVSAAGTVCQK